MRVRGTRVTLDTGLAAFREGATPEAIVQQYPSISLADVYQVIGYCLSQSSEIDAYLSERRATGQTAREHNNPTGRRTASVIGCSRAVGHSIALARVGGGSDPGSADSRRLDDNCACLRPRQKGTSHAGGFRGEPMFRFSSPLKTSCSSANAANRTNGKGRSGTCLSAEIPIRMRTTRVDRTSTTLVRFGRVGRRRTASGALAKNRLLHGHLHEGADEPLRVNRRDEAPDVMVPRRQRHRELKVHLIVSDDRQRRKP
jgi:uncharacterized protein (DUF433 family)